MMKKIIITYVITVTSLTVFSSPFRFMLIGPTMHINIGKTSKHASLGLEASYWNLPWGSIDLGVEYEFRAKKIRTYSEYQNGVIYGASFGYVREFQKDSTSKGGLQASVWAGITEFRFRYIRNSLDLCPGLFLKGYFGPAILSKGSSFNLNFM